MELILTEKDIKKKSLKQFKYAITSFLFEGVTSFKYMYCDQDYLKLDFSKVVDDKKLGKIDFIMVHSPNINPNSNLTLIRNIKAMIFPRDEIDQATIYFLSLIYNQPLNEGLIKQYTLNDIHDIYLQEVVSSIGSTNNKIIKEIRGHNESCYN